MECRNCHFDNPDAAVFCNQCGDRIEVPCPSCEQINPPDSNFCNACGIHIAGGGAASVVRDSQSLTHFENIPHEKVLTHQHPRSERKFITALFSDLNGYTEMSERLDAEEVKEITGAIFSELTLIVEKYGGFIEKYIGDAILAVFGAVETFEDSALRAIKASRDIHNHVESISPKYENRIGRPLSMHTGVNTGLVVTGDINFEKGTHGLVGDTINTAARLMAVSKAGEIIADQDSFTQTEGYFEFETLAPVKLKGKTEPISIYRVGRMLPTPLKLHRLHGLRSKLIGRSIEMQVLQDAASQLNYGQGTVLTLCGTAGTGKSRLVHEFKMGLDLKTTQWFDANAYPHTQNTPYYPLIDLLSQAFRLKEGDKADTVKRKVQLGLERLLGKGSDKIPYIAGLFFDAHPDTGKVSPEYWKDQLIVAVGDILNALTASKPTVICMEDMHWADPSFMELVRHLVLDISGPLLLICIYRPVISVLTTIESRALKLHVQSLRLNDLSPSETQRMVTCLLDSDRIPKDLRDFIRDNVEGNPFYVEELINTLIESKTLINKSDRWHLATPIEATGISMTIQGVVSGRIDRLAKDTKQIIQEASVVGRAFLYDILKRVSRIPERLDKSLVLLERLDLICSKSIQPTLEYIFKHALTQEIVYQGMIKSKRQAIHEKIGLVIEQLFEDRLSEFYEVLAFHFKNGSSKPKALEYLIRSGEKCMRRYAVQEADGYYREAYHILRHAYEDKKAAQEHLVDLLIKWSMVFYYRGDFKNHTELLQRHEAEAGRIKSKERMGMYFGWLGFILHFRGRLQDAFEYLQKALKIGKEIGNRRLTGYAYTWLTWVCAVSDKYDEGVAYWEKAVSIAKSEDGDFYLYQKSLSGICQINSFRGIKDHCHRIGTNLIQYGGQQSNIRSQVVGHMCRGHGYFVDGDFPRAIQSYRDAVGVAKDPFYTQWPKLYLGICCVLIGRWQEGEAALDEVAGYIDQYGCELFNGSALAFQGLVLINKGKMSLGLQSIKDAQAFGRQMQSGWCITLSELVLGNLYFQFAYGEKNAGLSTLVKNFGFLAKNLPYASKSAEHHFSQAIRNAKQYGAISLLGQAYLGLGLLYKAKRSKREAQKNISAAIEIFKQAGARTFQQTAIEALGDLLPTD